MNKLPAILGAAPLFDQAVPIVRPTLPALEAMSAEVADTLTTGMVTKGKYLRMFEEEVASHLGVRHAVAVSSCTAGLMLAYRGLGLSGEVVVPSFTFMATVSALVWAGLEPVFADVNRDTTNLDPAAAEAAITPQTSAIVAVHNFGNPADIEALEALARQHGVRLVFDAAHGFGALYRGAPVGPQGDVHVFSTSPTKLLVTGEGGVIATNDDDLAETVRIGREYGNQGDYDSAFAGLNARMPEYSAIMGRHSLRMLEDAAVRRNELVALFEDILGRLPGVRFQEVAPEDRCAYKDLSIAIDPEAFGLTRDDVARALAAERIDTRKYHAPPVHRHTAYRQYHRGRALPNTRWLAANSLSLPLWSHMSDEIAQNICRAIERIHAHAAAVREALA